MLDVSCSTVKAHNCKTLRSLGFLRRGQLIRYVFETGQFDPEAAERYLAVRHKKTHACRTASTVSVFSSFVAD